MKKPTKGEESERVCVYVREHACVFTDLCLKSSKELAACVNDKIALSRDNNMKTLIFTLAELDFSTRAGHQGADAFHQFRAFSQVVIAVSQLDMGNGEYLEVEVLRHERTRVHTPMNTDGTVKKYLISIRNG